MQKILIVAGEASGDLHGANLVRSTHQLNPNIQFVGIGSKHMQDAGVQLLFNADKIAVVGFFEVLRHWTDIRKAFYIIKSQLFHNKFNLLILIDYPGFNLRLAKLAKKAGVKVLYYISPQVWAWHKSRIKIIKKYVDLMAVVFPFEVPFYQKVGIKAELVGHTLINTVKTSMDKINFCQQYQLDPTNLILGLVPGSRKTEIKRLLPLMLKCATSLKKIYPNLQFVLPLAHTLSFNDIAFYPNNIDLDIKIISNSTYNALKVCDATIATSGTVTLEIALLGVPMVIVYKINPITYFIGRKLVQLDTFGICNILAGKKIVKEFIQDQATVKNICDEIQTIIENVNYRNTMIEELNKINLQLQNPSAKNIGNLVFELLQTRSLQSGF